MSTTTPAAAEQPTGVGRPEPRGFGVPAAVGVVVAAVVAVFAVVGLVVSLDSDRLPTGPALDPPPPPVAQVSYDPTYRQARYIDLLVYMPASPYVCPDSPGAVSPILASGLVCDAVIHPKYDGTRDWAASAAFGSVPEDLTRPTPDGTAKAIFQQWRTAAFSQQETTLSDYGTEKVEIDGRPATLVHGNVHYAVDGVPSTYDRVLVITVPTKDGSYAAFLSSRPDDTPKATLDKLNASLNSLHFDR